MQRREFITSSVAALVLGSGCVSSRRTAGSRPVPVGPDGIRSVLVHLGGNMWCDWYPDDIDRAKVGRSAPHLKMRTQEGPWRQVVDHAADRGLNQIVIDVGEGLVYPSHPELAVEGSWSAEKLAAEVDRLRDRGMEIIPKLNFSTTHSGWMKHYRRMVGTPAYYRFCEDVLRDVHEVFGSPRFVHIGCDEEDGYYHVMESKLRQYVVVRRGEVWKHDFLHLVRTVEGLGARAWAWSDYGWDHPEFLSWCPKSVLLSNWFYDECHGGFDLAKNDTTDKKILRQFYQLEEAGFDQVPCGTNWAGWKREEEKVGADDVIGSLVKLGRQVISDKHRLGFMMASWKMLDTENHIRETLKGIDLMAEACAPLDSTRSGGFSPTATSGR